MVLAAAVLKREAMARKLGSTTLPVQVMTDGQVLRDGTEFINLAVTQSTELPTGGLPRPNRAPGIFLGRMFSYKA
jgi:fatty acid-binding protein DegV